MWCLGRAAWAREAGGRSGGGQVSRVLRGWGSLRREEERFRLGSPPSLELQFLYKPSPRYQAPWSLGSGREKEGSVPIPLVARGVFRSSSLTEILEQATPNNKEQPITVADIVASSLWNFCNRSSLKCLSLGGKEIGFSDLIPRNTFERSYAETLPIRANYLQINNVLKSYITILRNEKKNLYNGIMNIRNQNTKQLAY